ncbi:MAG: DNA-processing protein DprA [Bdellovibrionales bacterium]
MNLENYLSLLSFQGCKISIEDFENLRIKNIKSPEEINSIVSNIETMEYLRINKSWWKQAEKDYRHCLKSSYKLTWPGQKDYPEVFSVYFKYPPILTYMGESNLHKDFFPITFVGSRRSDEITLNWMDFYMSQVIQDKKICVVSGGARGIDQKAHSIAIRTQSPTVCFLPSGLDNIYPFSLYELKKEILDTGGALISCFSPYQSMYKSFFHIRNRLMACYSKLVVILQAQSRSGTMLTAKKALDFGVPVSVLPGSPLSKNFTGNLQLLYDGAFLLRDHRDLSSLVETLNSQEQNFY